MESQFGALFGAIVVIVLLPTMHDIIQHSPVEFCLDCQLKSILLAQHVMFESFE